MRLRFTLRQLGKALNISSDTFSIKPSKTTLRAREDLLNNPIFQQRIQEFRKLLEGDCDESVLLIEFQKLSKEFSLSVLGREGLDQLILNNFADENYRVDTCRVSNNWDTAHTQHHLSDEIETAMYPVTIDIAAHATFPDILNWLKDNRDVIEKSLRLIAPNVKSSRDSRRHKKRDAYIADLKINHSLPFKEIVKKVKKHDDMEIRSSKFDEDAAKKAYKRAILRGRTGR